MEEIRTEEQMKEIQEAITYYHELLERNEMLEKRNQTMLKKIRQEKRDKLKAELCCKIYDNHSSCGYDIWILEWRLEDALLFFNYNGITKKSAQGFADLFRAQV